MEPSFLLLQRAYLEGTFNWILCSSRSFVISFGYMSFLLFQKMMDKDASLVKDFNELFTFFFFLKN